MLDKNNASRVGAQSKSSNLITPKALAFDLKVSDRYIRELLRESPFAHDHYQVWRFNARDGERVRKYLLKVRANGGRR